MNESTQGVVSVQLCEVRVFYQFLKKSICLVAPTLLNRPLALAFPTLVAPRVVEPLKDRKHHSGPLGQIPNMLLQSPRDRFA